MKRRQVPVAFGYDSSSGSEAEEDQNSRKRSKKLKGPMGTEVQVLEKGDAEDDQGSRKRSKKLKVGTEVQVLEKEDAAESSAADEDDADYMKEDFGVGSDGRRSLMSSKATGAEESQNSLERSLFDSNPDSIGLSIMKKMGFSRGDSLGNSTTAKDRRNTPINVTVKNDRSGIGVNRSAERERDDAPVEIDIPTYRTRLINSSSDSRTEHLIRKLQKICFHQSGDYDEFLDAPHQFVLSKVSVLWREYAFDFTHRDTTQHLSKRTPLFSDIRVDNAPSGKTLVMEEADILEWRSREPASKLQALHAFSRESFNYCVFCECFYDDQRDLQNNCPGPAEQDHY